MPPLVRGNLLASLPHAAADELVEVLGGGEELRIERIVSTGQASPAGSWYDQPDDEFVVLLAGAAVLRFEDGDRRFDLQPGDWIDIPAHARHRVERTQADPPTVWLAVHYRGRGRTRAVGSATNGSSGQ
jgi:cupin 2 domain-containing protein